ncbi:hypothetical protein Taro_046063 [Colocasia esculenta]|uniref:Uncharacterized protein n=1 Tax=Colocasia esculenta TaxID=4460 RepID=A0A843X3M7_COLES|nr:hypothetical protein [Colocasia esculenta]
MSALKREFKVLNRPGWSTRSSSSSQPVSNEFSALQASMSENSERMEHLLHTRLSTIQAQMKFSLTSMEKRLMDIETVLLPIPPPPPPNNDNIFCKGSVDTTIIGVDTMAQSKGRKVNKRSSSVDTSPGQVDTSDRSQRNMLTSLHLRSTPNQIVSTLESLPRRPVDTESSQVDTRDLSQGFDLPVWESVSTHLMGRSTHSGISVT